MDDWTGIPNNPMPYLIAAYGIGLLLIAGYAVWIYAEKRRLSRVQEEIARHEQRTPSRET